VPLGSRDRANALKLAAENADLRAEVERLQNILDHLIDQHAPKGGGRHG
jgi:hypothetical protein